MTPEAPATDTIFYDGHCGLCHRWVRLVAVRDSDGSLFRFAPLDGPTFQARVPQHLRAGLPDSVVVWTAGGSLRIRSDAVIHILRRLGRGWRALGTAVSLVPRPLRDGVYDWIARMRTRWFAHPADVCPVAPPELRRRFDP